MTIKYSKLLKMQSITDVHKLFFEIIVLIKSSQVPFKGMMVGVIHVCFVFCLCVFVLFFCFPFLN